MTTLSIVLGLSTSELKDHVEKCNEELAKRSRERAKRLCKLMKEHDQVELKLEKHKVHHAAVKQEREEKTTKYRNEQRAGSQNEQLRRELDMLELKYEASCMRQQSLVNLEDVIRSTLDQAAMKDSASHKRPREEEEDSESEEPQHSNFWPGSIDPMYLEPHPLDVLDD